MGFITHVQQRVVGCRLDPVDLAGLDNDDSVGALDDEARGVSLRRPELTEQGENATVRLAPAASLKMFARALNSSFEASCLERLQQIVQRMNLEGLKRVLIVGRRKNQNRKFSR